MPHESSAFLQVAHSIIEEFPERSFCLLNEKRLKNRVKLFKENFLPQAEFKEIRKIIYAIKANPNPEIIRILSESGIDGFDCASLGEIFQTPVDSPVYFNHPIKRRFEIDEAFKIGVRYFTVQSRCEIDKVLSSYAKIKNVYTDPPEISVRLKTTNPSAMINLSQKFGAPKEDVQNMLDHLRSIHEELRYGISIHTGSQNEDPEQFKFRICEISALARALGGVHSLNIGGGIPIHSDTDNELNVTKYLHLISEAIRKNIKGALLEDEFPKIIAEPGRSIIADSVDLLIPVLAKESRSRNKCLHIDDGIFNSFLDDVVHNWKYVLRPFPRLNGKPFSKLNSDYIIYGRTCDSGDKLSFAYPLPCDIDEGDYIHVPCAGAYMDSQTTNFNGFKPPQYIVYNK